ncbi:MAG: sensor histidine kinase [Betaproteobacteria bacterium]|nr:MAG: sensor histidine kinase [Betaproteobacteria bacterium]
MLLVGMLALGTWLSGAIEKRMIRHEGELFALYMDSVLSDQVQSLASGGLLSDAGMLALDKLLHGTMLGERIVAFKLWSRDGRVLYSTDLTQIGLRSEITPALAAAFRGETQSRMFALEDEQRRLQGAHGSELIEIYAPVRQPKTGLILTVAEIDQTTDILDQTVGAAQAQSWMAVIAAATLMYLLLAALIMPASNTLIAQKQQLQEKVSELTNLLAEKEQVHERVARAAGGTTARYERSLHRIAVDLHDGPVQGIALAAMRLETLADVCRACSAAIGAKSTVAEDFKRLQDALNSAQQDVRSLSKGLHLPNIEELSLGDVARRVVRDYKSSSGMDVELTINNVPEDGPLPVKITLFRLLQESLANGFRHGGAVKQHIVLGTSNNRLEVAVRDDGRGFDPQAAQTEGHLGLQGMRERVEVLGGTFYLWSAVGQGTVVRADIPLTSRDGA